MSTGTLDAPAPDTVRPSALEHKAAQPNTGGVLATDDQTGVVEALVSVTGIVDDVDDLIHPGAYASTLTKRRPKGVMSHDWGRWVSRTEQVEEWMPGDPRLPTKTRDDKPWPKDAGALYVKMRFNVRSDEGRNAYENVKFFSETGECEWSIGYHVPPGQALKDPKTGVRHIKALDLFEYSPVLFGAAPLSGTLSVKSRLAHLADAEPDDDIEAAFVDALHRDAAIDWDVVAEASAALDVVGVKSAVADIDEACMTAAFAAVGVADWAETDTKGYSGADWDLDLAAIAAERVAVKSASTRAPLGEGHNWVTEVGGLPMLIRRVAHHLIDKGRSESTAIATAVNWAKKMCSTGRAFGGKVKVSAKAQSAACSAVAEWERKKAEAHAKVLGEWAEGYEVKDLGGEFGLDTKAAGVEATPSDVRATERLRRWYVHGGGAARIEWGRDGDFMRCVKIAGQHMTPERAKGYCALRHRDATGGWPGHAPTEGGHKGLGLGVNISIHTPSDNIYAPGGTETKVTHWTPDAEVGEYAAHAFPGTDVDMEAKQFPFLTGSFEERQAALSSAVTTALQGDVVNDDGDREWAWVSVVGTFANRVIARREAYRGPNAGQCETYQMTYTFDPDSATITDLGDPEPVDMQVEVTVTTADADISEPDADEAGGPADGDADEPTALDAVLTIPLSYLASTAAGLKGALAAAGMETKAGRVLSAANETRLRAAVEHLIAVLRAAGVPIDTRANPDAPTPGAATDTTAPAQPTTGGGVTAPDAIGAATKALVGGVEAEVPDPAAFLASLRKG